MNSITSAALNRRYSVGSLLVFALTLATLPLAALGIWLEFSHFAASTAVTRTAFDESVDRAASEASATLNRVQGILSTLALDNEVRLGTTECRQRLRDAQRLNETITAITRYDARSATACTARETSNASGIIAQTWWTNAMHQAQFQVAKPAAPVQPPDATLLAILTMKTPAGSFDGTITADLAKTALPSLLRSARTMSGEAVFALSDSQSNIIHSNADSTAQMLFGSKPALAAPPPGPTHTTTLAGTSWIISSADVPVQGLKLSVAVTEQSLFGDARQRLILNVGIITALLVLTNALFILTANHRIARWMGMLHAAASTPLPHHANTLAVSMQGAPNEFRELGSALLSIIHQMNQRNADLEQAASLQNELAREVHHRVANTLQIVMSLMNLQAHRVKSQDARHAIEQARARVNTLALANRIVDSHHSRSDVDLQRVIEETIAQTVRQAGIMPGTFQVDSRIGPCSGNAATAIPLALFVNEAVSDAMEHGKPGSNALRQITVSLEQTDEDELTLSILCGGEGTGVTEEPAEENIRPLLMKALAMQLCGRLQPEGQARSACCLSLTFPVSSLA